MELLEYLGRALKSDEVMGLIEDFDMEILYHIDTLNENTPDSYSTRAAEVPFEFVFDEDQILTTIFYDVAPKVASAGASRLTLGAPLYETIEEARTGAQFLGASFEMRENVVIPALDLQVGWAKLIFADHSRHYEYGSNGLQRVTLSRLASAN